MTDEITERVLNESSDTDDDESSNNTSTVGPKGALTAFGVAIGIWVFLAVTVGWNKQFPAVGVSPGDAIMVTLMIFALIIITREARHLPLIPDLRNGLWDILLFWSILTAGSAVLAVIILWGPPGLSEMLREVGT